jgi:galactitol-specific phosphotransferase system IIB component
LKLTKGRAFALWALLLLLAVIAGGRTWYTLEMTPQDTAVILQAFDGFTTYAYLTPVLLLIASQSLFFFFSTKKIQMVVGALGAATSFALSMAVLLELQAQNISSLGKAVETATGIAATHGIDGVTVITEISGYLTVAALLFFAGAQVATILAVKSWPVRTSRTERKPAEAGEPEDTISLWDSQR